jgi:fimbrial chaperone protein
MKKTTWLAKQILASLLLWSVTLGTALAFSFEIDRIRLDLSLDEPVAGIRIKNTNDKGPVNLQITAMNWAQQNGKDVYTPTQDLILAPSVMSIPQTRSQIMRVGWRIPRPILNELTYRVYVHELNPTQKMDTRIGVQLKLNLGLPVFIKPDQPRYQYNWTITRSGNNFVVTFQNSGNVHVQINKLDIFDTQNKQLGTYGNPFYVLAQQSSQVTVPVSGYAGGDVKVMAATDYQPLVSNVKVS